MEFPYVADGNTKWYPLENSLAVVYIAKLIPTLWSSNSTPRLLPKVN